MRINSIVQDSNINSSRGISSSGDISSDGGISSEGTASELRRLFAIIVLSTIIGVIFGQVLITLLVGILLYNFYHLRHLHLLVKWLQHRRLEDVHDANGLWGQALDHLSRHKRRETRERSRLKAVIQRVEAITTALNDAVILINRDNGIDWWNEATAVLLDLKPNDVNNSIINYIRHPEFVSYLESGDYTIPLTLPSPQQAEKQLEFQITRFGEGNSLLVVRDVTRIYKLEQMRKDFVANLSHELRTPLTVIRGYLETLEDSQNTNLKNAAHLQKALQQMQQQTTRMTSMINDLTTLSKLETAPTNQKQSAVTLKPLLEMVCSEAIAISAERNHAISLSCDDNFILLGNDYELHSAFSNLLTNAIKYSSPNAAIIVKVSTNLANNLVVSVQDEGIGIKQQHISRLTERFYRVDASRCIQTGGTGLGLAIVKHILLRHDARLQIESTYNKGSQFSCIFPSERLIKTEMQKEI